MSAEINAIKQIAYKSVHAILLTLTTSVVFLVFIIDPGIDGFYRANFKDVVYGKAYKPYVYRTLVPSTVRLIASTLPTEVKTAINQSNLRIGEWDYDLLTEYWIASTLMFASLLGFGFSIKYLFNGVYQAPTFFVDAVSLAAIAIVPSFFKFYNYIYDFPNLFLFTTGLGLMARHKWNFFLILFPLICLNKETAILLTFVYVIHSIKHWKVLNKKQFIYFLLYQIGVFLLIKLGLNWIFRNNLGGTVEFHFFDHNTALILKPHPFSTVFLLLGLTILIVHKWNEKPVFLRSGIWMLAPLLTTFLFFGFLDEIRVLYEVYPVLLLLISYSIANLLDIDIITYPSPMVQ